MPERGEASLLRLIAWLSPAFPVGSYSYSHGLEQAVETGAVADSKSLRQWVASLLEHGSVWNDAVLLVEAWRQARSGLVPLEAAELAEAMAGSAERHLESTLQGAAFLKAASTWPHPTLDALPRHCAYSVAVGTAAGAHAIPLESACAAFLQAFASNQLQAAIRLSVTGQVEAVSILASLESVILETAARAARSSLDDIGSATIAAEIASMNHETQYSRLFRS